MLKSGLHKFSFLLLFILVGVIVFPNLKMLENNGVYAAGINETAQGSVVKDTYAESGFAATPPGNQKLLYLGYNTSYSKYKNRIYIQFSLPSLPANSVIDSVSLQLRYCYSQATSPFGVTAYQVNSGWDEYGLTWNNQPSIGGAVGYGTIAISYSYQSIDITPLGQAWYSGTPNYGVAIFANNESALGGAFYSKEGNNSATPPQLIINYHVEAPPNNPPTAQDASVTTAEDTPIEIKLQASDPDGNSLKYSINSNPSNGSLSGNAPDLLYTPNADYYGTDAFTFSVNDGLANSNVATVSINITPVEDIVRKSWTFMLYFSGDNNLEHVLRQAKERLEALPANQAVNLVVLIDGYAHQDTFRYLIQPGGVYSNETKWHLIELDMGSAKTLQDFVSWSMDTYPADNYYLAIANHGGGTYGVSSDDTSHSLISPVALGNALRTATYDGVRKIDVLHFDACLMAMMEVFYEVSQYTDYVVASENLGWGVFAFDSYQNISGTNDIAPYEYSTVVQSITISTTPQELASLITETYYNHPALSRLPRTISSVNSSSTQAMNTAVNNLAEALIVGLDQPAIKDAVSLARINVQKLDSENYGSLDINERFVDLYDFADQLSIGITDTTIRNAAQAVKSAILQWIVSEYHASGRMTYNQETNYVELEKVHGASIFFPPRPNNYDYAKYVGNNLFLFTANNKWDEFLQKYMGVMALPPDNSPPPSLPWILDPLIIKMYLPTIRR